MCRIGPFGMCCIVLTLAGWLNACRAQADMVIDYNTTVTQPGEHIRVIRGNNANPPTTVNVDITEGHHDSGIDAFDNSIVNLLNGEVGGDIVAHDTATINTHGGRIGEMYTLDSGTINVYGGYLDEEALRALDSGTVNIYGADFGEHGADVFADNSATVNVYGGFTVHIDVRATGSSSLNLFDGYFEDVTVSGSSKSQIYGGHFDEDFEAHDSSEIDVRGGGLSIEAWDSSSIRVFNGSVGVGVTDASSVHIFGGHIWGMYAAEWSPTPSSAVITVYGTHFNYPYGPIPDADGTLTGTLPAATRSMRSFPSGTAPRSSSRYRNPPAPSCSHSLHHGVFGRRCEQRDRAQSGVAIHENFAVFHGPG